MDIVGPSGDRRPCQLQGVVFESPQNLFRHYEAMGIDLSAASADHGLSVDPITAQRVEVVRGPASLLYGNNALGGVVNVISNDIPTEVPNHREGYVGGQTESVSPGGALAASLTQPLGERFALTLRGNWRDVASVHTGGDGRLDNTDASAMGASRCLRSPRSK